jgi:hypothetical protein
MVGSLAVAALVGGLVLGVWYPEPYRSLSGGLHLLGILLAVDVTLGPLLTAVVAHPNKSGSELRRDLCVIVLLQAMALAYGLHALALARPALVVFEVDRLRVLTALDLQDLPLAEAPSDLRDVTWTGPRLIAAREPVDPKEQFASIEQALRGLDLAMQPRHWVPYPDLAAKAYAAAKPLKAAWRELPELQDPSSKTSRPLGLLRYLPIDSRHGSAIAILEPGGAVTGYLPVTE